MEKNEPILVDNGALRDDEEKTQFHLFPVDGLRELAFVYMAGKKKYAERNWEKGMDWSRCFNSLLRHLYAWWGGDSHDEETGLHHMAHVAWNALALLVYSIRGVGFDDRPARAAKVETQNMTHGELPTVETKNGCFKPFIGMQFKKNIEGITWIVTGISDSPSAKGFNARPADFSSMNSVLFFPHDILQVIA